MNINRIEIIANEIIKKNVVQIETDLNYNSFYTESEKRAVRTYIGSVDPREVSKYDISNALDISKEILKNKESKDYSDYENTHQSLLERLTDFH